MNTRAAIVLLLTAPSLAEHCRLTPSGIHRPRRPLLKHEAMVMLRAWAVCYADEPDFPDFTCEKVVADWLGYLSGPLGYWPSGGDAVPFGDPVLLS